MDEETRRRLEALEDRQADTHLLAALGDRDIADVKVAIARQDKVLTDHGHKLDRLTEVSQEHTGRFESIDMQLRSLTEMVGLVLERLPEPPRE